MWRRRRGGATELCGKVFTAIKLDGQYCACELPGGHDSSHEHDGPWAYAKWRETSGGGQYGEVFKTKPF